MPKSLKKRVGISIFLVNMKKLENQQMTRIQGGELTPTKTAGCGLMGMAATWASIASGPAALGIGLLTYGGCLLINA